MPSLIVWKCVLWHIFFIVSVRQSFIYVFVSVPFLLFFRNRLYVFPLKEHHLLQASPVCFFIFIYFFLDLRIWNFYFIQLNLCFVEHVFYCSSFVSSFQITLFHFFLFFLLPIRKTWSSFLVWIKCSHFWQLEHYKCSRQVLYFTCILCFAQW